MAIIVDQNPRNGLVGATAERCNLPPAMDNLRAISSQFLQLQKDVREDEEHESLKEHTERFMELLTATCAVVEQGDIDASAEEMADDMINHMVSYAYEEDMSMDFLDSFAHRRGGIVKDPTSKGIGSIGAGSIASLVAILAEFAEDPAKVTSYPGVKRDSYYVIERPHEKTSPMARFRMDVSHSPVTQATPSALAVFQARLSMTDTRTCMPIKLWLPPDSSCLALLQSGGYKNRDPVLSVYYCDVESEYEFCKKANIEPGLLETATHIASDAERKLVYIADNSRIKSYQYGSESELLPKHTLQSKNSGPIALIQNGRRILRAGKTGIDIWAVDTLPDHGSEGNNRIGDGEIYTGDSWREEGAEIELSTGTPPESSITFMEGSKIEPDVWSTFHDTQKMLVAPKDSYRCFNVDLESGCKITGRHLGHGGHVNGFSTSSADPNAFLTSCNDGIVRLFDIRESLPSLSINAGNQTEVISSALYVHVDGLPIIITGGRRSEAIKVWDPRAKAIVYELATGNNAVANMAWDAPRSTLFAATECRWMDRLGYHHEYRRAKIPKEHDPYRASGPWGSAMDVEIEEEDYDDDDDEERYWPQRAHHDETYFGYAIDAGEHRLFRYKFGLDADPSIVPDYGQACPSGGGW